MSLPAFSLPCAAVSAVAAFVVVFTGDLSAREAFHLNHNDICPAPVAAPVAAPVGKPQAPALLTCTNDDYNKVHTSMPASVKDHFEKKMALDEFTSVFPLLAQHRLPVAGPGFVNNEMTKLVTNMGTSNAVLNDLQSWRKSHPRRRFECAYELAYERTLTNNSKKGRQLQFLVCCLLDLAVAGAAVAGEAAADAGAAAVVDTAAEATADAATEAAADTAADTATDTAADADTAADDASEIAKKIDSAYKCFNCIIKICPDVSKKFKAASADVVTITKASLSMDIATIKAVKSSFSAGEKCEKCAVKCYDLVKG